MFTTSAAAAAVFIFEPFDRTGAIAALLSIGIAWIVHSVTSALQAVKDQARMQVLQATRRR